MHKVKQVNNFHHDKQMQLREFLYNGCWLENRWPLSEIAALLPNAKKKLPIPKREFKKTSAINFDWGLSTGLILELKFALKSSFESQEWTINEGSLGFAHKIMKFIANEPRVQSLLDMDIEKWVIRFRNYLVAKGLAFTSIHKFLRPDGTEYFAKVDSQCIGSLRSLYKRIFDYYDERDEWDKDVIDLRKTGVSINKTRSSHLLNMLSINQPWLREMSRFAYKSLSGCSTGGTIIQYHEAMKAFSTFLSSKRRDILKVNEIDRQLILEYFAHLKSQNKCGALTDRTSYVWAITLNKILSECQSEKYPCLTSDKFILRHDLPKSPPVKGASRDIPEDVVEQMEAALDQIATPWRFILILMLSTGARISEILTLNIDCLSQDKEGTYWLTRNLLKQQNDSHQVPIPMEIAVMVKTIIEENEQKHGAKCTLVFPGRNPTNPLNQCTCCRQINRTLRVNDVKHHGKLWHFQNHQCRHYVASKWLDKGIEIHFIQRFLGHHSPENTLVYARIKEARLREANKAFVESRPSNFQVDKSANVLPGMPSASGLLSKMLWVQTLPNGFCTRPSSAKPCDAHIECFACDDFATTRQFRPVFEVELKQGLELAQRANELGLETVEMRQTSKNAILNNYIELLVVQDTVNASEVKYDSSCSK